MGIPINSIRQNAEKSQEKVSDNEKASLRGGRHILLCDFDELKGTRYAADAATRPRARQPFTERLPFCKQNRPVRVPKLTE